MKKAVRSLLSVPVAAAALAVAVLSAACLSGCEVDSTNTSSVVANSSGTVYDFSSLYRPTGDAVEYLVFPAEKQSGTKLTWMRIVQDGSVLQGYDNAGRNWNGRISGLDDTVAHFTLDGATTAGNAVTIAGTMTYASQQSTINASWLESTGFSGNFFATGAVSAPATNTPSSGLTVSPSSATLSVNEARVFTAAGGDGNYRWSHTSSCGTLSATSGSSVTYSHATSGSDVLTVTSAGKSASASIVCE
jgi:hypothetical protein